MWVRIGQKDKRYISLGKGLRMERAGSVLIKIVCVLYILIGILGLIGSAAMIAFLPMIESDPTILSIYEQSGIDVNSLDSMIVPAIASSVVTLIAAILGLLGSNREERFKFAIAAGVLIVVDFVVQTVITATSTGLSAGSLLTSLILPLVLILALVLKGVAYRNQKRLKSMRMA